MRLLKQSTTVTIQMGPFLDDTDGQTEETALSPTVQLSKNGAVFAARNSATAITHDADGYYRVEIDATDTNTLGRLRAKSHVAGALPVWEDFMVLPAVVYDSLIGGSDNLQTHAVEISSGLITAATFAASAIDASSLATDAVNEIRNAVTGGNYALDTDANGRVRIVDGTAAGELDTQNGEVSVDRFNASLDLNATMKASVNAEVDSALDTAIPVSPVAGSVNERLKTLDDAYTATRAGYLDNLNGHTPQSGDTFAQLPTNFAALAITAGGAVDSLVQGFLNTLVSETTAGRIAGNFDTFFENADAASTKVLDDIGSVTSIAAGAITAASIATDAIDADSLATDAVNEIRNAMTGGNYALDTDANGRVRVVDGTAAGELDTASGKVFLADGAHGGAATVITLGTPLVVNTTQVEGSDATNQIADALLDRAAAIDGKTVREALRYVAAVVCGLIPTGAGTGTETFRGLDGVTNRVQLNVDGSGNRTGATYDPP